MKSFRFLIASAAFAFLATVTCLGQATLGVIAGSVTDNSDAVVLGATVTVQRTEGGEPKVVKTGDSLHYLTFELPLFALLTVRAVVKEPETVDILSALKDGIILRRAGSGMAVA